MAAYLLAMTQFSAYAFYLLAVLYVGMSAYVLLGGWVRVANRQRFRLLWLLVLPMAIFITLWFCGRGIWAILFWMFVFGDVGPYEEYGRSVSAAVAVLVSATVLIRIAWGFANRRFLRICLGGTVSLGVVFGAMLSLEVANRIYGWTAHGAAENYLARTPVADPSAPNRIIEVSMPNQGQHSRQVRRFILYYGDTPIHEVCVAEYGWWWWTLAGSGPAFSTELDWAVDHWETDREEAINRLEAINRDYPGSVTSRMAAARLERLRREDRRYRDGNR